MRLVGERQRQLPLRREPNCCCFPVAVAMQQRIRSERILWAALRSQTAGYSRVVHCCVTLHLPACTAAQRSLRLCNRATLSAALTGRCGNTSGSPSDSLNGCTPRCSMAQALLCAPSRMASFRACRKMQAVGTAAAGAVTAVPSPTAAAPHLHVTALFISIPLPRNIWSCRTVDLAPPREWRTAQRSSWLACAPCRASRL